MAIKIGLDCGHGLKTAGKQTPDGIKEWSLNDKVRKKVISILSDYDVEIIHTDNNEGNVDESLSSRVAKYQSAGVSAFVSIHHNAYTGTWNDITGVEVYTDTNPTSKDLSLASSIYNRLVSYTGLKGRGIKKQPFYVINQNTIPAVLVEGGLMDSRIDYPVITSDAGQTAYAKAVAEGLIEFLGLKKKSSTPVSTTTTTSSVNINKSYIYKKIDYKLVFNPTYYSNKYSDLKKAFGTNESKLLQHFVEYGMKECRQACEWFNVNIYKNNYIDLQKAFKNDMPSYYIHYINFGYKENRKASSTISSTTSTPSSNNSATSQKVNITYAVKTKDGKILSEVKNLSDYAGIENKEIIGLVIKVDKGSVKYQVHTKGGSWLPYVTGYNWNDHNNGYAGNGNVIDAIRVYYNTPSDLVKNGDYKEAKYRVSSIGSTTYCNWQLDDTIDKTKGLNGYAGSFGKSIDKIQISIE